MRNHFLRAAAGAAVPIEFVGASANSGNNITAWSTANVAVTAGDVGIFWSSGTSTSTGGPLSPPGFDDIDFLTTASFTSIANTSVGSDANLAGIGGNNYLFERIEIVEFTSSGNAYVESAGTRYCGGGVIVVSGGDSAVLNTDKATDESGAGLGTVSLSGIDENDILVYIVTSQLEDDLGTSDSAPSIPVTFTQTVTPNTSWTSGLGGGADGWWNRGSYLESPSSSFSYEFGTAEGAGQADAGVLIRIYNT